MELKQLKQLLKVLRDNGITDYKTPELELKLGDLPRAEAEVSPVEVDPQDPYANFPQGELTPEQLMFYSSGGDPSEDPAREAS